MTIYVPDLAGRAGPRYRAIADAVADDAAAGRIATGDRLPTHRALADRLGITVGTVTRAYALLAERGIVAGEVGRGTYVAMAPAPPEADEDGGFVDMTRNEPAFGPLHREALTASLRHLAAEADTTALLGYATDPEHPHGGSPADVRLWRQAERLRDAGVAWLAAQGIDVDARQVVQTVGAQQALTASVAALTRPGEPVLLEAMTYGVLVEAVRFLGRRQVPVALADGGMSPEALDRAARESGARIAFLVPNLHNPTGAVMPEAVRREIVAVARRRDLILVEDDVYGFLLRPGTPEHLFNMAPERTVYVCNASKCAAPGLRVGWAAAPERYAGQLAAAVRATNVMVPALPFAVAAHWVETGLAGRLADWQRAEMAERQKLVRRRLDGLRLEGHPAGLHLLLHLPPPWRADAFQAAARERGVGVLPASAFAAGDAVAPEAVRLALGQPATRAALERAADILAGLALQVPRAAAVI